MFGTKEKGNKVAKSTNTSTGSHSLNTLVEGTVVEGQVQAKSDIRIDGVIKGSLTCDAKVIIGETGYIEGQIVCANAMIQGRFEGTLHVKELLNVRQTAKVNGEITTNKLIVEAGAIFNVTCRMGRQATNANSGRKNQQHQIKKLKKEAS